MKQVLLAGVMLSILGVQPVMAQRPRAFIGSLTCVEWQADERTSPGNLNEDLVWVAGFLSGVNWASDVDVLKDQTPLVIRKYVDDYCLDHPSAYSSDAAMAFYELRAQSLTKSAPK